MKQVNKSFLEEQVRKQLFEQAAPGQEKQLTKSAKNMQNSNSEDSDSTLDKSLEVTKKILISLPFGDPDGWSDQKEWLEAFGAYGWGADKYYKLVLDKIGNIEKDVNERQIPFSQLMLRFYQTAPVGPGEEMDPKTLNLIPKEELANELAKLRDWTYNGLISAVRENDIDEIEDILKTAGYDNNLSFEVFGGLDESLYDIANSYGFLGNNSNLYGAKNLTTQKTLFKDPEGLANNGLYRDIAEDIAKDGADPTTLLYNVEKFIMFHFNGLEDAGFKKAMMRLQFKASLPRVAMAHLAYQDANELGAKALISFLDTTTATISTALLAVSVVASIGTAGTATPTVGASLAIRAGQKLGIESIKKILIKTGESKIVKAAMVLNDSTMYAQTIKRFGNLKYQLSPLLFMLGKGIASVIQENLNDIRDKNETFFKDFKKATPEQRAQFYESDIKPSLSFIAKKHAELLTKSKINPEFLQVNVLNLDISKKAYMDFDKKYILKMEKNIKDMSDKLESLEEQTSGLTSKFKSADKHQQQVEKAQKAAKSRLESPPTVLPIASAFQSSQAPAVKKTPGSSLPKELKNFGSNEKTSDEIYNDIVAAFSNTVNEAVEAEVININLGYKDAIEFAKGTKGFSPETTKANIDKIRKLVQSKGKQVKFTPVAALTDDPEGVDTDKFKEFSKEINSHIETKKVSTVKPSQVVQEPTVKEPPSDREATQGKDVSDVSGPEILIIGDSTSNNIVNSNKFLHRGKKETREPGYYGKDGTRYYAKDFGGSHNKAMAAAKADGGGAIFPGWSGHASHGGAGTTYIKNSLNKLLARDTSYIPKVAIISMGYNDPPSVSKKGTSINNFKSIISALKERGVKDIRIIEPRADKGSKGSFKRNADLIRPGVYDLADSVVKIVPNPTTQDGGPPRRDGVHYTSAGAQRLFKDAMSGLTVSKDIVPQAQTTSPASIPSKATSEGVPYSLVTSKLGITKTQYDLYRVTLGQRESGQKYNIKGGAKDLFDGFYQMGPAAKIDSGIKLPDGASDWNSEVARKYFRENPAVQEEAFGKMTAKNMGYLNTPGEHTEKWDQLKQDPATKLGILAVAHLLGHGGAKKFINNNLKNAGDDGFGTKDIEYYNLIKNALARGGAVAVSSPAATASKPKKKLNPPSMNKIESAQDYDDLLSAILSAFDITSGGATRAMGDLTLAFRRLNNANIEGFMKGRVDQLKSIHRLNRSRWKDEYKKDIAAAAGDQDKIDAADRKQAWYHRPIVFMQVMPSGFRQFFLRKPRITFAFETTTNRVSTSYRGREIFYNKDTENNSMYQRFIKDISLLRDSMKTALNKYVSLKNTDEEEYKKYQSIEQYFSMFINILDSTITGLESTSLSASRKAYLLNVLDMAFRTN